MRFRKKTTFIFCTIKKLRFLDDNSDENEALEFGSDDYGSDGSQDEEDVSFFEFGKWGLLEISWIFIFILNSRFVFLIQG